jgi:hypothetical protein
MLSTPFDQAELKAISLMVPAPLVEVHGKIGRQSGRAAILRGIAIRARHARGAATARMLAIPRLFRMAHTNPAAVIAERTFHGEIVVWKGCRRVAFVGSLPTNAGMIRNPFSL